MKFFLIVEKILKYICICLILTLFLVVSFQIFSRVLTGKSFSWMEELTIFLLAWTSFLSGAYAAKKQANFKIVYFVEKFLSVKGQKILNIILNLILIFVMIYLICVGFAFSKRAMKISMFLIPIKKGLMYLSFPVGMLFLTTFLCEDFINGIKALKEIEN